MVCPSFWEDYYMLIYTHCWELMNSVGSHGSLSLLFMMKVMVCHFVSDSHEVMTALIVVLPLIVVVEISLQLHRSLIIELVDNNVFRHLLPMGKLLTSQRQSTCPLDSGFLAVGFYFEISQILI
jgi:hypothetical protein